MASKLISIIVSLALTATICNAQCPQFIQIPLGNPAYNLEYVIEADQITFHATVETSGWVGFGFTNVSGMVQADIFIGGVDSEGNAYSGDYNSASVGTPSADTVQDWQLTEATEKDGITTVAFSRKLNTGDMEDDIIIEDKPMTVIWAIGPIDEINSASYHIGNRDHVAFNLVSESGGPCGTEVPTGSTNAPTGSTDAPITGSTDAPITGSTDAPITGSTDAPITGSTGAPTTESQCPQFIQIPLGNPAYNLEYVIEADQITFHATVETTGWVGFGFTNVSGMVQADIFIGGVDSEGNTYSGDYNSASVGKPSADTVQDWQLIEATEKDGITTVAFSRKLNTGDMEDDIIIEDKPMTVIWAIGPIDEINSASYHIGNRDHVAFNLVSESGGPCDTEVPTGPTTNAPTGSTDAVDSGRDSVKPLSILLITALVVLSTISTYL